jgi:MFS family permease
MIALSWVSYRLHIPALVQQFKLGPGAAPQILLIEALLAIAIEPLAGLLSDRTQARHGTRFPIIIGGVVLTSGLFVAVAALAAFGQPTATSGSWMFLLLILWGITISFLRPPAIALLKRYAPSRRLPQAASVLTFAAGIAGAATPLASQQILNLGAPIAFVGSAILLVVAVVFFRATNPPGPAIAAEQPTASPLSLNNLTLVFAIGLGSTLGFRLLIETFPKILKAQIPGAAPPVFVGLFFITFAVSALFTAPLAVHIGSRKAIGWGMVAMAIFLGLMLSTQSILFAVLISLALGVSFGIVSNGIFPYALAAFSSRQAGLAIGIFFAGGAAATSLSLGVLSQPEALSPPLATWLAATVLLTTGFCVVASRTAKVDQIHQLG